ncbi:MAG: LexA family transcriptional regulator [Flavobacteriales bacterium]
MDKTLILNEIKSHYNFKTNSDFAKFLGIRPQVLSNWFSRNTFDTELIYTKCLNLNPHWLITGEGEMLQNNLTKQTEALPFELEDNSNKPIPLVNVSAAAGFGSSDFHIQQEDVKDYYVIPKFKHYDIDFMIEVRGSSMYPKYNSGDVIACTILKQSNFIQWNKVHVIATKEQGLLVKRVKKGDCEECISAVSDNKEYDPFFIPKDEITGLAIVVGVIRLE